MSRKPSTPEPSFGYLKENLQKSADAQPLVVSCAFCPGWTVSGSSGETRAAATAHRKQHHPETLRPKPKRKASVFSRSLTAADEKRIDRERQQRMREFGIAEN